LSGANVWRGELRGEALFALKLHPPGFPADRLRRIHSWWKLADADPVVPKLHASERFAHRHWELIGWKPGQPAAPLDANDARLDAACRAIARLHEVWKPLQTYGPIPAVARRIERLQSWSPTAETGLRRDAGEVVRRYRTGLLIELSAWHKREFPLQPVLADVHAGHLLFNGISLSGVIDFAAMKHDSVAVDAARYLGDACLGHDPAFRRGCEFFSRHHGESACPYELVGLLDRSGTLAAIAHWLQAPPANREATERLAYQMERWHRLPPMR
jgi:Ser/Thr protein kinase RdoA (MazF antagonist)